MIVRRERPHPGAQLSFTDHDGYRFQAILTDQTDPDIAVLERRHRQRARVEDRIRDDKDTGLAKLPFKAFALNEVWVEIVMLAHDLIVWTQALVLDGELAKAEPKRLRYRLLHVAARLAFPAAAPSCTSRTPGPGPPNSKPRLRNSSAPRRDRLTPAAADPAPSRPTGHRRERRCQRTAQTALRRLRGTSPQPTPAQ